MKIVVVLVQFIVTGGVFYYLAQKLDLAAVFAAIKGISGLGLAAAMLLCVLQMILISYRLRFALRVLGSNCSILTSLRSVLSGAFFGQTPLSNFGGDMVRIWTIYRDGVPLRTAASAVTLDRVFGFLSLVVLILLTLPVLWIHVPDPTLRWGIVLALCITGIGVAAFLTLQKIPSVFRQRSKIADWIGQVSREFHVVLLAKKTSAILLGLGIGAHLLSLLIITILSYEVGMGVTFFQVLYLMPFPLLASLLPVSIGGWGVREAAMIVAFGLVGVPAAKTLSASIMFGILSLVIALPGSLVWLHSQLTPAKVRELEQETKVEAACEARCGP